MQTIQEQIEARHLISDLHKRLLAYKGTMEAEWEPEPLKTATNELQAALLAYLTTYEQLSQQFHHKTEENH